MLSLVMKSKVKDLCGAPNKGKKCMGDKVYPNSRVHFWPNLFKDDGTKYFFKHGSTKTDKEEQKDMTFLSFCPMMGTDTGDLRHWLLGT